MYGPEEEEGEGEEGKRKKKRGNERGRRNGCVLSDLLPHWRRYVGNSSRVESTILEPLETGAARLAKNIHCVHVLD